MENTPYPKAIAAALVKVREAVKKLPKTEENKFARYDFVSVDAFYEAVGPLLCEAKLTVLSDCIDSTLIETGMKGDKRIFQLREQWAFYFVHEVGEVAGPYHRYVTVPAEGAQAHGSSESFSTKHFLRGVFKIPTGDKDDPDFQQPKPHTPTPVKPFAVMPEGDNPSNEQITEAGRKLYGYLAKSPPGDVDGWLGQNNELLTLLKAVDDKAETAVREIAAKRKGA